MKYKREVILNFPLRNSNRKISSLKEEINKGEIEIKERLSRFYRMTERLRETEWHQEYFLIYNSYVLDNA